MQNNAVGKILFTREQIEQRAHEIGQQISRDYEGEEIYLVGTLRGAVMWMAADTEKQKRKQSRTLQNQV